MFNEWQRNGVRPIVLVSGWAFDGGIFAPLDMPFNFITYAKTRMADFEEDLLVYLNRTGIERVSLMGWSQGAHAAAQFSARHPQLIETLTLVSLRPVYDPESIQQIASLLHRNRRTYLRQFYKSCFSGLDLESYRWFKQTLERRYLDMFTETELSRGLEWLCQARLTAQDLASVDSLVVFHGREDRIAPVEDVMRLVAELPQARFVLLQKGGHVPFLSPEFSQHWHG